jgi:hypothetical protein
MPWHFPDDRPFDLECEHVYLSACRLVEHDSDTVTVDFEGKCGTRLRGQVGLDQVRGVFSVPPIPDAASRWRGP